jgi:hypothetical protein
MAAIMRDYDWSGGSARDLFLRKAMPLRNLQIMVAEFERGAVSARN